MSFVRDRLVEGFFWAVGFTPNPQFGFCRKLSTKLAVLITTIDDIYDVYGTLDELELFTDIVDRFVHMLYIFSSLSIFILSCHLKDNYP